MDTSMAGKTVLFTGATRGMGRVAAVELARRGAEVLVVGRDAVRGAEALAELRGAGKAELFVADVGDADQVVELAAKVRARSGGLDVVIHNAGCFPPAGARTAQGVDRGYAANFLGPWLLTRLLEEKILGTGGARVIAVSSMGHRMVKQFRLEALTRPGEDLAQMDSYGMAKLALVPWIYGLAKRWGARASANVLDPGMVTTEIGAQFEGPALQRWLMFTVLPGLFGVGQRKGSEQYVKLAAARELDGVSGRYFVGGREKASSPLSHDEVLARRIEDHAERWATPWLQARRAA